MTRAAPNRSDNESHPPGFEPFVVVRASAGTGKTHALSTRLIGLLADGAAVDDVFAATFARKAAGEILDRVLERLAIAASPGERAATAALAEAIGRPGVDAAFFRDLLVRVTRSIDRLAVSTLDAFFVTCADAARFEIGLPPGWTIGTEADLALRRRRAIQRTIHDTVRGPARAGTPAAVLATLMVQLSGGATTAGLEESIEGIVADLAAIHRDTEPGAWEWLRRPKPPSAEAVTAARETLAGFAFDDKRFATARDAAVDALDRQDWTGLVSKGMIPKRLAGETMFCGKAIDATVVGALDTLVELARWFILSRAAEQTRAIRDLLDRVAATADRLAASEGIVSFDDVTRLVGTAAGDGTLDSARWRGIRFARHLLLDEFQDTSPGQWRVLERLAEHTITADGSFFAVGDRKQAIYGWRGGAAELLDVLEEFFARGSGSLVSHELARSWRSSPAVLEAVNRVFDRIADAEPLADHASLAAEAGKSFPRHLAADARKKLPGWVRLRTCRGAEEGEKATEVLLAEAARRAAILSRANPGLSVGLLVRTNSAAERVIARLKTLGIVASAEGGQPLDDSPAVELVLSALHLVDHPGDSTARFHVGTSPLAGELGLDARRAAASRVPASCLAAIDRWRRRLVDEGYGPALARWAGVVAPAGSPRDRRRLEQLLAAARTWDLEGGATDGGLVRTGPFVAHCRSVAVADPVPSPIRVMTIHKAKGLEFDVVVLTDLDRKIVARPPRLVVDRESVLAPVRRVLVHLPKESLPLLPADWQECSRRASDPVVRESIATLYVGLTRAARAMEILVLPATAKERNVPRTLAGVLRTTLPDDPAAPAETVLWSHGHHADPADDALPDLPEAADEAPPAAVATATAIPLRAPPHGRRRRSRPTRAPSAAEGGRVVGAATLLDPGSRAARSVGTLLHAWIERYGWPATPPDDESLRAIAGREPLLAGQFDTLLADFRGMCAAPTVARLLAEPPRRLPARFVDADLPAGPAEPALSRERSFAIEDRGETILGIVDRLVVWRRDGRAVAAEVIDFKFDAVGSTRAGRTRAVAEKTEFYAPQLRAYRQAVAALYGLPPRRVACTLAFMRSGDLVDVEG